MKNKLLPLLVVLASTSLMLNAAAEDGNSQSTNSTPVIPKAETATTTTNGKLIDANEQLMLAMSRRPPIVGAELLQQEAEGFRNLPAQAIQAWRNGRLDF